MSCFTKQQDQQLTVVVLLRIQINESLGRLVHQCCANKDRRPSSTKINALLFCAFSSQLDHFNHFTFFFFYFVTKNHPLQSLFVSYSTQMQYFEKLISFSFSLHFNYPSNIFSSSCKKYDEHLQKACLVSSSDFAKLKIK